MSIQPWQDQSEVRMGCERLGPPIHLYKPSGPMWTLVPTLSPSLSQCFCPLPRVAVSHPRALRGKQDHDSQHKWQPHVGLAESYERWQAPLWREREKTAAAMIMLQELVTVDLFISLINFSSLIKLLFISHLIIVCE